MKVSFLVLYVNHIILTFYRPDTVFLILLILFKLQSHAFMNLQTQYQKEHHQALHHIGLIAAVLLAVERYDSVLFFLENSRD